jgi:squalene-hopene/tetraprenyl-beta-curcumene cyclase
VKLPGKKTLTAAIAAVALQGSISPRLLQAAEITTPTAAQKQVVLKGNESLKQEVAHAIAKGAEYLRSIQKPEGYWSSKDEPAITALVLTALQGQTGKPDPKSDHLKKGYDFLLQFVHPDGSIHNENRHVNYNTSVSLLAFMANVKEFRDVAEKARKYLLSTQVDLGEKGKLDTAFDGGVGYGTKSDHSDLANTQQALEALYYSRSLAKDDTGKPQGGDLNWEAAIHFLQNCQNLPSVNQQPWASDDAANKGGFIYYPGNSMAGQTNLANGRVALRSYGNISYAGLLSYIYADLKKDDPRVQAVLNWLKDNYTLEENPAMGQAGLFYYFNTMAKALSLLGLDELELNNGKKVNWREQLTLKLLDLKKQDGSWVNENARWLEKDSALVTAYCLISLERLHQGL